MKTPLISALVFAALSQPVQAWQPCVPICDLFCAGLTMSLRSAEHTVKIGTGLAVETLKLRAATGRLKGDYKKYGDSLLDEWENASSDIIEAVSTSTIVQLSTTDIISDSIGNMSIVVDASLKSRNAALAGHITDLVNSISANTRSMTNSLLLANEPEYLSSLTASDILPTLNERNTLDGLKKYQIKQQKNFTETQKNIRKALNGNRTKLEYLSLDARQNVARQLFGLSAGNASELEDPLLAKSSSIPLRRSLARSFVLDFYSPDSKSLLQNSMRSETDLYGKLLIEINQKNQNLMRDFEIKFDQPFKDL